MGAYHDKIFTDCGNDSGSVKAKALEHSDVVDDDDGADYQRLDTDVFRPKRLISRRQSGDSCTSSATDSLDHDKDICIGGLHKVLEVDEELKDEAADKYEESPVTESRYAFEKSKLARTRTIAVCQRRPTLSLWAWDKEDRKMFSDDMFGKVLVCSSFHYKISMG